MLQTMLIVANWKMNGSSAQAKILLNEVKKNYLGSNKVIICPPFTLLNEIKKQLDGSRISLGAQNCSSNDNGAFTGEISTEMLVDIGCEYVIIGHSERRQYNGESDKTINKKAKKVIESGLIPIICVGESLEEREQGRLVELINRQLEVATSGLENSKIIIAYEPVWAIGTGKTASSEEITEVHKLIKNKFPNVKILYGGSVHDGNCHEISSVDGVDGFLVGGASLSSNKFLEIINLA